MSATDEEQEFIASLHGDLEQNSSIKDESFYGLYNFLARETEGGDPEEKLQLPILIIIKNIKLFPQGVLNDLIHLIKKYREAPYGLKLNLMIGVQNNNTDEFHMRIKIQNAVKMTVKKFQFPCMKNIIFEVIYHMSLTPQSPITFSPECY